MAFRLYIPESIKTYGFIFVLIAASFYVAAQFIEPAPPREFTLAAGSKNGAYYAYAQKYKEHLAESGTKVTVLETSGSLENIRLLNEGKADFAFVQSGLAANYDGDLSDLMGLGSLYFEPLWVFIDKNFKTRSFRDFNGLRLAVGGIGSGTQAITKAVLQASGISGQEAQLHDIGGAEAFEALKAGKVDGVFISSGISSDLVQKMLHEPEFRLFSESRAVAYEKQFPYLSHLTLPEGVMDLAANVPKTDTQLLASAALMVAGPEAHQTLRALMVHTAHQIHGEKGPYVQNIDFPSARFSDFALSSEAERYYEHGPSFLQRYMPFWIADLVNRLKVMLIPLITIMIPLMKIAPPTYRWRIRSKIYKWYKSLKKAEDVNTSSNKEIQNALDMLEDMDREAKRTPVPLSYADELYNLRMHIRMVRERLRAAERGEDIMEPVGDRSSDQDVQDTEQEKKQANTNEASL